MNPYNAAHTLAKALRECQEYKDYKSAQEILKDDAQAKEMLKDFRSEQFKLQRQKLSGLEVAKEQEEKVSKLYSVISMNLTIKRFLEAEQRMGVILQDVQKIITEATGDLMDPELLGFDLSELEDEGEEQ